ncbi:MAG: undecaprenyldiphospho-muramoylpentapeptide beta-N-acetylglucosaminyltransferase [Bacillota bacterium]|nr:undecaprenyldiphospho-muramoylpentapeptide beta-N-acetylglucosaminyltransferase [Bacillota bacterium]MDP4168977.1 undecaprenyldiphospho-muramoylpentapeptide beta-N-acetylglucosaminyltransferase [Bacillota bacterium]
MKIAISGGGTGGHIYPALALVREIQKEAGNHEFLYIGTQNGLESSLVPAENIPFKSIHITGFKRKISLDNVKTIFRFLKGVRDSKEYLKEFKPDVVIGTGGYVCGPVVYAAAKLGIPTVIHEQNSVPGLTNKFLSRYVNKIAVCFKEAADYFPNDKVIFTGNPRASEVRGKDGIRGRLSAGLKTNSPAVLIFGGSRGARPINDAVIKSLSELGKKPYQILYVTGEAHFENVKKEVDLIGNPQNVVIQPFIHNMPEVLAGVDLVVSRAGATTLAEVTSLGIPSILIPSPYVTNNHQEKNARSLSDEGAAVLLLEKDLNSKTLIHSIDEILLDKEKQSAMKKKALKLGVPDSATKLYKLMKQLAASKKR